MTIIRSANKGAHITRKAGLWALPVVVLSASYIWAQEGGLTAQLSVGQTLRHEDEKGVTGPEDEGLSSDTTLGFSLSSRTQNQSLSLSLNTAVRYEFDDNGSGDRLGLNDPSARLSYAIENRRSKLSFEGSYRRADIDEVVFLGDELDPLDDIITGGGTRTTKGLRTKLELGREGPLSAELTHFYGRTDYSGTTSTSLVPLKTQELGARVNLEISPQATVFAFANVKDRDAERAGTNDHRTQTVGLGTDYTISPTLSAKVQLSYSKIDTDDNAGTLTSRNGLGYSLGVTKIVPNGEMSLSFSEEETINGKRRNLTAKRGYELRRGSLSWSLGVSKSDGLSAQPLANLNASYELSKLSTLSVNLSQSSSINDNEEESINTQLSVKYARELSPRSSLSAGLQLVDRNALTAGAENQTSTRINLSHNYELARELDLVTGYRYTKTTRDNQATRKSNEIFLGLQKNFNFRP